MGKHRPVVAIVGLPNVGKSTLFNRILKRKVSIVDRRPGVTRDRIRAKAEWSGVVFDLIDTGGMVDPRSGSLESEVMQQVEHALAEADLILFVVDGKVGDNPIEDEIADKLRKSQRDLIFVANKVDVIESTNYYEHSRTGLGVPFPISAANGTGIGDLLDGVIEKLPEGFSEKVEGDRIKIAVLGRPNAGKSSFVNRVLGEKRVIVSADAGTTRDSVDSTFRYMGREIVLVDTAGLRKKSRIKGDLEFYASRRVMQSLERADVVILILDPVTGIGKQDFKIAELAEERGKGILFAVTKWDLIEDRERQVVEMEKTIAEEGPGFNYVPIMFISSVTGLRVRNTLQGVLEIFEERTKRVPTSEFNRVLSRILQEYQPPQIRGKHVKILYGSQVAVSPPRFVLFATAPSLIRSNYRRFIMRKFREYMGFAGVPIFLSIRGRGDKQ